MEPVRSRIKWQGIVIAVLALAVLALLVWLFQRPSEPARDIVFGELGHRPDTNNAVAVGRTGGPTNDSAELVSNDRLGVTNTPRGEEPENEQTNQSSGRMAPRPHAVQTGSGAGTGDSASGPPGNASSENNNALSSASSSNQAPSSPPPAVPGNPSPATSASARVRHTRSLLYEDAPPPEPVNKDSTAALLAEAKAAGRGPDNPTPARTADLLGNDGRPRVFDPETGSNVVFILDNSLSMMANGKSDSARQELARTLESMSASQNFYVLFFHSGGYEGMPSLGPVPASPENVRAMTNWLFNVGHRTGADPTKALQRALGLAPAPDTVWILSDSELPDVVVDNIREANAFVNAHINTVGFYSRAGEQGLRRVANENRGAYRFIPPPDAAPAP
jgi:hypothetical protein